MKLQTIRRSVFKLVRGTLHWPHRNANDGGSNFFTSPPKLAH